MILRNNYFQYIDEKREKKKENYEEMKDIRKHGQISH